MFNSLRQVQSAFSHLNPATVKAIAAKPVRVGLIASSEAGYAAMEEVLVPAAAPPFERQRGLNFLYRGGDPYAPSHVDVVLYEQGIPTPRGAYVLFREEPEI